MCILITPPLPSPLLFLFSPPNIRLSGIFFTFYNLKYAFLRRFTSFLVQFSPLSHFDFFPTPYYFFFSSGHHPPSPPKSATIVSYVYLNCIVLTKWAGLHSLKIGQELLAVRRTQPITIGQNISTTNVQLLQW